MWEFLRKANGRCGNCGAKFLKADAKIRILVCQSCGAKNKSSWLNNFIGLLILISFNRFIFDNISSPYNWIIIFFGILLLILFINSKIRLKVISETNKEE
tara:strand:+ start:250 stop:549 length:300 start_codon:yes stop_codon:yes gene_type:complete